MSPQFLGLGRVDFITVGAEGPPGERVFYLQAAQGDLLVSLKIEKEQAAALSLGIYQLLEQLGGIPADALLPTDLTLRQPIEPLFRVASLGLGHDAELDAVLLVARGEAEVPEEAPEVRIWGSRAQMLALAQRAAEVVAAGRPRCPLCGEPYKPGESHNCIRGNGRKWLYRVDEE
jgi:uncharacterized repeat protein (TIGR03847 family)